MKEIYADNAATTKISDNVLEVMENCLQYNYGNPSSLYKIGQQSKKIIEEARFTIADFIGAKELEICFTSGGTESNNWAIRGVIDAVEHKNKVHIITTNIEHSSILNLCKYLETKDVEVTYLPVDRNGFITEHQVLDAIKPNTVLVSVMYANNEIGTIQPIKEIGEICRDKGVLFHTDAVQVFGKYNINVNDLHVDLMSISGHKIHAPKGVGALYIKNGTKINNLLFGGKQEFGKRCGTENVAGIAAFGEVVSNINKETLTCEITYTTMLKNALINTIIDQIPHSYLNGSWDKRLCGNINISFEGVEGESIVLGMAQQGIYISSGSACSSGSLSPSHVLKAINRSDELAHGSVRITIDKNNTYEEIQIIVETLKTVVEKLRMISPLWNGTLGGINNIK